ncbi:Arc family DNA-binding protein [Pontibaca salina]|nr:Arc family DNA-binding protein [Pontibaca salina]
MLRLPDGMRDRIKDAAANNNRSMNAEIVATLEEKYPAPSDVMHIHLSNIRRALDIYERTTDPRERLRLQALVEGMATLGHDLEVTFDDPSPSDDD